MNTVSLCPSLSPALSRLILLTAYECALVGNHLQSSIPSALIREQAHLPNWLCKVEIISCQLFIVSSGRGRPIFRLGGEEAHPSDCLRGSKCAHKAHNKNKTNRLPAVMGFLLLGLGFCLVWFREPPSPCRYFRSSYSRIRNRPGFTGELDAFESLEMTCSAGCSPLVRSRSRGRMLEGPADTKWERGSPGRQLL
uniref:Uncharacterized protein n=1 Tax=Solanum tuberosum TaxID=4113 RepID=M1A285_SOLTU